MLTVSLTVKYLLFFDDSPYQKLECMQSKQENGFFGHVVFDGSNGCCWYWLLKYCRSRSISHSGRFVSSFNSKGLKNLDSSFMIDIGIEGSMIACSLIASKNKSSSSMWLKGKIDCVHSVHIQLLFSRFLYNSSVFLTNGRQLIWNRLWQVAQFK